MKCKDFSSFILHTLSRSVEINITGFSDWGLGMLGLGSLTQSPVPSTRHTTTCVSWEPSYLSFLCSVSFAKVLLAKRRTYLSLSSKASTRTEAGISTSEPIARRVLATR